MNEYQETYEKEISLMDLMFYCLKKWAYSRKLFAICLFAPINYRRDIFHKVW